MTCCSAEQNCQVSSSPCAAGKLSGPTYGLVRVDGRGHGSLRAAVAGEGCGGEGDEVRAGGCALRRCGRHGDRQCAEHEEVHKRQHFARLFPITSTVESKSCDSRGSMLELMLVIGRNQSRSIQIMWLLLCLNIPGETGLGTAQEPVSPRAI
jgi:hypothetical protein